MLADGQKVVAVVTHDSVEALDVRLGAEAFALIKASWIILLTDASGIRLSARNQLSGTVQQVTTGAVNSEVVLRLPDGNEIVAIITNGSVGNLALAPGSRATAAFKASSVIVGVKA